MTKLDIAMQFPTFCLDEESSWLCVIVTPFGKYRYKKLPMGLVNSPAWAQSSMEELFQDMMHEIEIYIDILLLMYMLMVQLLLLGML